MLHPVVQDEICETLGIDGGRSGKTRTASSGTGWDSRDLISLNVFSNQREMPIIAIREITIPMPRER